MKEAAQPPAAAANLLTRSGRKRGVCKTCNRPRAKGISHAKCQGDHLVVAGARVPDGKGGQKWVGEAFGHAGMAVGATFGAGMWDPETRQRFKVGAPQAELVLRGVHRATCAGIWGTAKRGGAYSIIVASESAYGDDVDDGETMQYTGEGGIDRDAIKHLNKRNHHELNKDQEWTKGNAALRENMVMGNPVRVMRSSKLKNSAFKPDRVQGAPKGKSRDTLQYAGLYRVTKAVLERGTGTPHRVCKFTLTRAPGQAPLVPAQGDRAPRFVDGPDAE